MKILSFLNPQNILTILACVGVFFLATKIESCSNAKELGRMDKKVAQLQEKATKDSATISNQTKAIFDLEQTISSSKDNTKDFQTTIAKLTKERDDARKDAKVNLEAIEHYEQNDLIRYFTKDCLSKWYKEVFEKPKNIKE